MSVELKKYIVFFSERSDGPQCNRDAIRLVESPIVSTLELLRKNYMVADGHCTNVSYPGCEDCSGSRITNFRVEPYSPEIAKQLGLVEKLWGTDRKFFDNMCHRLKEN